MSTVDDVKARLDIVEVVGSYVRLQKSGRYFKAPCPFHQEKTPSFIVNPDRQSWHCFGACASGGDVIAFVARKENLDFGGALRLLAERAGVELQNEGPRREQAKGLQDANEAAALYFHALLANARPALSYLEERGLDRQTIADFQLGFAPPGWESLRDHLSSRGFSPQLLYEAGLLVEGERGYYDRFRDRLMFPIRDERGRVAGFGGRVLPPSADSQGAPQRFEAGPKYMNTPQTPIFDKSGLLYGLDRASVSMRQSATAVVVEGYMDVIAAHQHGFRNVVAAMGTSLTERQVALCERNAGRVVLAMDADNAGNAASLRDVFLVLARAERRASPVATGRGIRNEGKLAADWRVAVIPSGKDPDEFIRSQPEAWPPLVEHADSFVQHFFNLARAGRNLADPAQRQAVTEQMLPVLAELTSTEQAAWIRRLAVGSRAAEDAIWQQLRRRRGAASSSSQDRSPRTPESAPAAAASAPRRDRREEFCLALLHRFGELRPLSDALDEELFSLSENREIYRRWLNEEEIKEEERELYEHYQQVLETRVGLTETAQVRAAFFDCIDRLRHVRMRAVKEASALALAEGETGVKPGQVASIARALLEAGNPEEESSDGQLQAVASTLLEDMEAGLRFHRRFVEDSRPDQAGQQSP